MKFVFATLLAFGFMNVASAVESNGEAANAKMNDVKRDMKKKGHHIQEAVCAEGDAKCLAKKGKHRAEEGADYAKDKTNEGMDKVDGDGKARK